jgi:rhodanese-related sulfurtransferase
MDVPQTLPREALEAQQGGALLVDVREHDEWASGRIPGAVHLPMSELQLRLDEWPDAERVIVVCRSGARSDVVAHALVRAGHAGLENLAGGVLAWQALGLPLEPAGAHVT